jgi:uncharacterized membrane protein YfcA
MIHLLGYLASAFIGLSLGLIGGGGSILTVPVLVYLFDVEPVMATSYSLFIVGITSLTGAWPKFRDGQVDLRLALQFGIPSIAAVHLVRRYLVPAIPEVVGHIGNTEITRGVFLLLVFSLLMIGASYSMIRGLEMSPVKKGNRTPLLILDGLLIGTLTGMVGAGGGFIIIPALVFLGGLGMKEAVGTSLVIIAANSLFGFAGDLGHYEINWKLVLIITIIAITGIIAGHRLSRKFESGKLKKAFGWFILFTGIYIIIHELVTA